MNIFEKVEVNKMVSVFTWVGIGLGCFFPVLAILLDFEVKDLDISPRNFVVLIRQNPLHWIILMAPVILGAVFYVMSKALYEREIALVVKMDREIKLNRGIGKFVSQMEQGDYGALSDEALRGTEIALILEKFQDKLKRDKEEERVRDWINGGLANFGELMRKHNEVDQLAYHFITELVKYLKFCQGGIFLYQKSDEGKEYLVLKACYAYERKKYLKKEVEIGTGLVSQCYLEKSPIIMCDVPPDYVQITSGLGGANPNCIILCPLVSGDVVEGVIELAGFRKLLDVEVEFIQKVCESLAMVLHSVGITSSNKQLVEMYKQQAEILEAKEEELKKTMREMEETVLELLTTKKD